MAPGLKDAILDITEEIQLGYGGITIQLDHLTMVPVKFASEVRKGELSMSKF